jgi:nucleoside-diphosphate-sugar epimerase
MNILVTGGTGFIGAALVRELARRGHTVRVFDNDSRGRAGNIGGSGVEIVRGDVRDLAQVRRACGGMELVYHLAYINGTRYFYEIPDAVLEVAVRGTLNVFDAAAECGVRRVVYASSSEVYHLPEKIPTDESVKLQIPDATNPRFSYGGGKLIGELLTLHYLRRKGVEGVIFRPHNVYGPAMGFEHVVPEFVARMYQLSQGFAKRRITFPIQGSGKETRAFCYIDDAVSGILLVGERGGDGEIYHVGDDGAETAIDEIAARIAAELGLELDLEAGPLARGSTPRRMPSINKARLLGFTPRVGLAEGLRTTVRWYRDYYLQPPRAEAA